MHTKSLLKQLLRIEKIVIENTYFEAVDEEAILVIRVRPLARDKSRCPHCGKRCPGYDSQTKVRRWRSLDLGSTRVYLESTAPRVQCPEHGVVVAKVPWARHATGYTYDFETTVTWLALHATAQDIAEYFRIDWHMVGSIARRVQRSLEAEQPNRFDGLSEIGIDETSYNKGHKYMTVVVNHRTGSLIWAAKGHGKEVLSQFFEEQTEEQRAGIRLVSADGARWITSCINAYCPNAERCIDPFHVVAWANDCLDEVRKQAVREAKEKAAEGEKAQRSSKKKEREAREPEGSEIRAAEEP